MKRLRLAVFVVLAVTVLAGRASAEPPVVTHLETLGFAPGAKSDFVFGGQQLADAHTLWTNLPGVTGVLAKQKSKKADHAAFTVDMPADAPLGVYGARVTTAGGVSGLMLFMLDDLPAVRETARHATLETAQEFHLPAAIEGAVESAATDCYKFHALAGQRVSIEVVARRLGSPLDGTLRLLDRSGRELAHADDDPVTGADPRLVYTFAEEGDYLLELRDIRYEGGAAFRYRLRLGDFPLATAPWPLAARRGSIAKLTITGTSVEGLSPLNLPITTASSTTMIPVPLRYREGYGSSVVSLIASDRLEQVEFEPNDTPEQATVIETTGNLNGRFERPHDADYYQFTAKKGERLSFIGQARTLGSPADLYLRLFDAAGKQLAAADDSGVEEGSFDYTFTEEGEYRLAVEELLHRGSSDCVYRVEIRPVEPRFTLAVDADHYNAPAKGSISMKFTAVRRGYTGPIELSIEGPNTAGWQLARNTLPEGATTATLTIDVPETALPGDAFYISIVGRAKSDSIKAEAVASSIVPLRTTLNGLGYVPPGLDTTIAVGVGPVAADFFELVVDPQTPKFAQRSGVTEFKVAVKRLGKFVDRVTLKLEGLPSEFKAETPVIARGTSESTIKITGPKNLALGAYPIRIEGTSVYLGQTKTVTLATTLEITGAGK
jgi:hypothetical protein